VREALLETESEIEAGDAPRDGAPAMGRISAGTLIGRYVVLAELGAGAMGVVLAAYDPKLDRKVALKLLKPLPGASERHGARLQREAVALAKLDHPNVVAVHDVGEHEGMLFVGMEYVEGQTLRTWMSTHAGPRPWPEVLRVLGEAGRGLMAAHEAGLIHRDVKPDNIMVAHDGRVRVMDFGLVRHEDEAPTTAEQEQDARAFASSVSSVLEVMATLPSDAPLTQTGAMMGTPAYMPLEQFGGGEVDARSDQFSFCVVLYEALYGERPFASESIGEQLHAVAHSQVRAPPRDTKVPAWVRKLVLRGLAKDKRDRWPSIAVLLDALADDPARRRGRWRNVALVVALVGAVALGAWYAVDQDARTCSGMDAALAGVWDDAQRRELQAAIEGTQLSYAPGTWERVEGKLDAYTQAWVAARVAACEATHRGEQSGELLDLRMACLDERLEHLRTTIEILADADEAIVGRAVQTVEGLPRLDPCADTDALRDRVPLPTDPQQARLVEELDARLVEVGTLTLAGRYEAGLAEVDAVLREAEALAYEPLLVRAWLRRGTLEIETGAYEAAAQTFERTYRAALSLRMMSEAATAAAELIVVDGYALARPADGRRWALDAQSLARAVRSDDIRARILNNLGAVDLREGKYEDALEHFTEAHDIRARLLGPKHVETSNALANMGIAAAEAGDYLQARRELEQVLELRIETLGPEHPKVAGALHNLSTVALEAGDHARAGPLLERALAIKERDLGPNHPDVATTLGSLSRVALAGGRLDQARAHSLRALSINEQTFGDSHPTLVEPLQYLGRVALAQGELEQARVYLERARAIIGASLGADHPDLAPVLDDLAQVAEAERAASAR
jgi:tetratricopeptide (TPR) repeat protein/tRNA A-37 threonylcarbamoyl transferase component Bud32